MKIKRLILFACIAVGVVSVLTACGKTSLQKDEPTTGALEMPDYTDEIEGLFVRCSDGTELILSEDNGAIVLGGDMDFGNMNNGDKIKIYCNGIEETFPARAEVVEAVFMGKGSEEDLPQELLNELQNLGFTLSESEEE